jgi:heme A synthase
VANVNRQHSGYILGRKGVAVQICHRFPIFLFFHNLKTLFYCIYLWWRRRESNPTSVLKTLNLLILGMTALQEMQ